MHNVPKGSETHFKVVVVTDKFDGVSLIKRHRLVMDILDQQLQDGVHALSIQVYTYMKPHPLITTPTQADTPERWEQRGHKITRSPPCLGGSNK